MVRKLRKFTNPSAVDAGTRPNPRRYSPLRPKECLWQSNGAFLGDFDPAIWKTETAVCIIGFLSASCSLVHISQIEGIPPTSVASLHLHNMSAVRGLISSMASLITNINDDKFAHDRNVLIRVNPFLRRFRLPSTTPTLPSFYHHQVPSLILHLERGRETRDDADRHLHRPTAARTPQPIERTASAARGTNNTTNSYNQQLRKTITAITRTRKKNHTKR